MKKFLRQFHKKEREMNRTIAAFLVFAFFGCSQPATETETLLICEGDGTSLIALPGGNGKDRLTFTIIKIGDKVTKVKSDHGLYTLEKVDASTKEHKGPVYVQLIVEGDKLILRTEVTQDKVTRNTILFNTGKYTQDRVFGWSEGQCSVGKKAF
jgi:hypothetical protein